jgi:AhpD family alkylhydroperoxidase
MHSLLLFSLLLCTPVVGSAQDAKPADAARKEIQSMFGFVPGFLKAVPDVAMAGAWEEMKTLQMNPNTALPGKIKELIGVAVAAQVPCRYCTYAHTQFAKLNGATEIEIGEAVILASLTRHWSTVLQGFQTDAVKFRAEIAKMIAYAKKMSAGQASAPQAIEVTDANSALKDIEQSWGSVPEFMKRFPAVALAGAWKEERDVEMSPATALSGKHKSLIGLAVASQIPCRFCIIADTEFARVEGATEAEIAEAIAMAALTRHWSTFLNGIMADEPAFRKDVDHLVRSAKQQAAKHAPQAANQAKSDAGKPADAATVVATSTR